MTTAGSARRKKRADLAFVATCGSGLEQLVAAEISAAGGKNPVITPGAVAWEGNLETGYRLCLWSRFASRVLLQIGQFEAPDQETLYQQASKIDWDAHFTPRQTFAVFSTLTEAPIGHSKFAALRIKDAIADQFRARAGRRPFVDTGSPDIRINLHMHGYLTTLALDLSGESLHRRGYRLESVEAPLKETLAAAIVQLAGFSREFPADGVLLDPMCGSGTLLIEAALLFGDSAPGLQRNSFGFLGWNKHDERLWERLVAEALAREEEALAREWPQFIGYDADPRAVGAARENVRAAGLTDRIQISQRQLAALNRPAETGMLLVNPPYGERLEDTETIKYLYRCLGRKIGQELAGWRIGFFASNPDLADSLGIAWSASHRLYNGPIKCKLNCGVAQEKKQAPRQLPALQPPAPDRQEGLDFANRLYKNGRALFPWAMREGVSCFRLYDADLPDFNLTVDLYDGLVLVREYAAAPKVDEQKAEHRFNLAVQLVREVLQLPRSALYLNRRMSRDKKRDKGPPPKGRLLEVTEGECRFLVSLPGDPATGLDLSQRTIRQTIGSLAQGRTFLNLFGGTGTATVHALLGSVHTSALVDPSAAALQRARANFALNGFGGQHAVIEADCLQWLAKCRSRYSLILVNPPAAGRDKKDKFSFDPQADHARLLRLAMQRLARQGQLLFLATSRKFCLDPSLAQEFVVREITAQVVAEDFRQGRHPLRCWELRHPQEQPSDLVSS